MKSFVTVFALAPLLMLGAPPVHAQAQTVARRAGVRASPAAAAVPEPRFNIEKFNVHGATLITAEGLRLILAPFIGKGKDFGDVQRSARGVEKILYQPRLQRRSGDPARAADRPGEVEFESSKPRSARSSSRATSISTRPTSARACHRCSKDRRRISITSRITCASSTKTRPSRPPSVAQRHGGRPGRRGRSRRGRAPNKLSFTLDNTGTQQTGMFRAGVGYQNANMFNRDHVLNAQYVTAPNGDRCARPARLVSKQGTCSSSARNTRFRCTAWRFGGFSAGYSTVNSGVVANLFNISGSGSILGVRYNQNLEKIGDWSTSSATAWTGAPTGAR